MGLMRLMRRMRMMTGRWLVMGLRGWTLLSKFCSTAWQDEG